MKGNLIQEKTFLFALRIVKLYKNLVETKKEYVLAKQLLRSGTSIGANVEESIGGQSKNDFLSKMSIAYKEARESMYWVKLLHGSNYLRRTDSISLQNDLTDILRILAKIQITTKNK